MNLKRLTILLLFGVTASVGYGAATSDGPSLAPMDNVSASPLFFGANSATANIPGGNAIEAASSAGGSQVTSPAAAVAVPEPGTIALLAVGLLGVVGVSVRRRGHSA